MKKEALPSERLGKKQIFLSVKSLGDIHQRLTGQAQIQSIDGLNTCEEQHGSSLAQH